ncbi:MAG: magnesium transporter [Candidatus Nealsonbacteria bacterium]|nr:magnesium transporter [Candidatus Nealsonbacteria bacterium]
MIKFFKKKYPPESAGKKMVPNVPVCGIKNTVLEVKNMIFKKASELETFNYVYVTDKGKLVGVFSIQEVFKRPDKSVVETFMKTDVVSIKPYSDQEKVAILAIKHNLKAIPVVDKKGDLLGVVPSDTILDILHNEHVEDMLLSVGIREADGFSTKIEKASPRELAKMRLPWLTVGLFGGMVAAIITTFFKEPLSEHFILTAFIPLILYMAGALSAQTQTLYVRSLAIGRISQKDYFRREIKVGLLMGIVLSSLMFLVSFLMAGTLLTGLILAVSLFIITGFTILVTIVIVWVLFSKGKDPALGSGPFGTIVADISALVIYFIVATILLDLLL